MLLSSTVITKHLKMEHSAEHCPNMCKEIQTWWDWILAAVWSLLDYSHVNPQPLRQMQGILTETNLPWTFTVKVPSQKIYFSTIFNVRILFKSVAIVRVPCMVGKTTPRQNHIGCLGRRGDLYLTGHAVNYVKTQAWISYQILVLV